MFRVKSLKRLVLNVFTIGFSQFTQESGIGFQSGDPVGCRLRGVGSTLKHATGPKPFGI